MPAHGHMAWISQSLAEYGFYLQLTVAQVRCATTLKGHGMHAALVALAQSGLVPELVSLYQNAVTR